MMMKNPMRITKIKMKMIRIKKIEGKMSFNLIKKIKNKKIRRMNNYRQKKKIRIKISKEILTISKKIRKKKEKKKKEILIKKKLMN